MGFLAVDDEEMDADDVVVGGCSSPSRRSHAPMGTNVVEFDDDDIVPCEHSARAHGGGLLPSRRKKKKKKKKGLRGHPLQAVPPRPIGAVGPPFPSSPLDVVGFDSSDDFFTPVPPPRPPSASSASFINRRFPTGRTDALLPVHGPQLPPPAIRRPLPVPFPIPGGLRRLDAVVVRARVRAPLFGSRHANRTADARPGMLNGSHVSQTNRSMAPQPIPAPVPRPRIGIRFHHRHRPRMAMTQPTATTSASSRPSSSRFRFWGDGKRAIRESVVRRGRRRPIAPINQNQSGFRVPNEWRPETSPCRRAQKRKSSSSSSSMMSCAPVQPGSRTRRCHRRPNGRTNSTNFVASKSSSSSSVSRRLLHGLWIGAAEGLSELCRPGTVKNQALNTAGRIAADLVIDAASAASKANLGLKSVIGLLASVPRRLSGAFESIGWLNALRVATVALSKGLDCVLGETVGGVIPGLQTLKSLWDISRAISSDGLATASLLGFRIVVAIATQAVIPVPFVGSFVGSIAGAVAASLVSKFGKAFLAPFQG